VDSRALKRFRIKYYVDSKPHKGLGTPCWLWTGAKWNRGYGYFYVLCMKRADGSRLTQRMGAHKVMWEHVNGPVPKGLELDHLCREPRCVNPKHLEAVTHAENVKRGEAGLHNPVKTHCSNGHVYDEVGFYIIKSDPRGQYRRCKRCHADKAKARRKVMRDGAIKNSRC
jgi:hypothetical protein